MRISRLLIVDDDALQRELLEVLLAECAEEVAAAASGEEALEVIRESGPAFEVVLTDLNLPGISGSALLQALRAAGARSIVAMSASQPSPAERSGADAFLQKPFGAEEFFAVANGGDGRSASVSDAEVLDESVYAKLVALMPPATVEAMYAMAVDDSEKRLGRMEASAAAGDDAAFRSEAHALKGSAGMLGATELQQMASEMERGAVADTSAIVEFRAGLERLRRILAAHP